MLINNFNFSTEAIFLFFYLFSFLSNLKERSFRSRRTAMRPRREYDWDSRLERAFTQRIYLMDSRQLDDKSFHFKMMGNSGKPYDISVASGEDISCTCPDHSMWGNLCKHIMHLLIRVMGLPRETVYHTYFRPNNFEVGSETIHFCMSWFARKESAANEVGEVEEEDAGHVKRRPIEDDDDCPVCYESFGDTKNEETIWCRAGCGKSVHQSCFLKWSQALTKEYGSRKTVGCVYCRTEWVWM